MHCPLKKYKKFTKSPNTSVSPAFIQTDKTNFPTLLLYTSTSAIANLKPE